MAAEKKVNYTETEVQSMVADYQAGKTVEQIAEDMGRAVRSVRSKLVREGVYVAPEKPVKAKREEGPTKKELVNTLETLVPFNCDGFMNATKEAISALISHLTAAQAIETENELDSE